MTDNCLDEARELPRVEHNIGHYIAEFTGPMREYSNRARATLVRRPVMQICDAHNSIVVYNKAYGISVPIQRVGRIPFLSFFASPPSDPADFMTVFPRADLVIEPSYGGQAPIRGADDTLECYAYPCMMDACTRAALAACGARVQWRSLLHSGAALDLPDGIIAVEGMVYRVDATGEYVEERDTDAMCRVLSDLCARLDCAQGPAAGAQCLSHRAGADGVCAAGGE